MMFVSFYSQNLSNHRFRKRSECDQNWYIGPGFANSIIIYGHEMYLCLRLFFPMILPQIIFNDIRVGALSRQVCGQ